MTRLRSICVSAALLAILSACHREQKGGHGTVSGQILPGSISDAMLPYDAVKSKPPLAPEEPSEPAHAAAGASNADSADSAAATDASAPDVGASPATAAPAAAN